MYTGLVIDNIVYSILQSVYRSNIGPYNMYTVAVNFHQRWVFLADFSLNSWSIYMKFASTLCNYSGAYREKFVKFESVLQKLDHLTCSRISR